jgi:hypothetical protein
MVEAPPAVGPIRHGPYPEEGPKGMEREKAHPSGRVDSVLMRMVARLGNDVGNVMNSNDAVEQHHYDKKQNSKGEIIQKWIANHSRLSF